MSENIVLEAIVKEKTGKGPARQLRREGRVPAIIYGNDGKDEIMVSLSERDLSMHCYKPTFRSSIIEIKVGKDSYKVLPKAVDVHPVTDRVEHVDFMRLSKSKEVKISVPLRLIGQEKSIGVKRGGMINLVTRRVDVYCKENAIADIKSIEVDIASLNIGGRLRLSDLALPNNVRLVTKNTTQTILTLVGRGKSEATEAASAEAAAPAK